MIIFLSKSRVLIFDGDSKLEHEVKIAYNNLFAKFLTVIFTLCTRLEGL